MSKKLTEYVDPFIGVDDGGNCLCGPYLPLSLVRLGPDTFENINTNGYHSDKPIIRFSHNHVSGTGGASRYGNIGITPFIGKVSFEEKSYEKKDEWAEAGYYSVILKPDNIKAELTVTPRVGIHRYTFPEESSVNIMLDASSVVRIFNKKPYEECAACIGGFIETISDVEVIGRSDCKGGWGHTFPYSVYFYVRFQETPIKRVMLGNGEETLKTEVDGPDCRAIFSFDNNIINIKVGISYVSVAKARESLIREAKDKSFDIIRQEALEVWEKALSRIKLQGGKEEDKKLFYTLFTRLICMPTDLGIDDENPAWYSGIRGFTDYYCLWDSVRNANSLITLFDPELEVAMLNSLIDVADHIGWLPDAWVAGHSAMIQGGSSGDILICEAKLKGLEGINYEKALLQMRKNNEVESPDPYLYGRYLNEYINLGYLSTNIKKNCVSRHLEYTYQDYCIGTLARELGQEEVADKYIESSKKIWNLWRKDIKFFGPKDEEGNWVDFDPGKCLIDCWNDPYFYEGTSWQWSFSVHQDFNGLVERLGGKEAFVKHLDKFFDEGHYHSKETMLHVPYLYIYAGRPDKTVERVREALEKYFKPTRNGLADNEDMGCQSAFFMCSTMGLYPIMGQDLYLLTTPYFERLEINLGKAAKLIIECPDAGKKTYIKGVYLNGQFLDRAYLRHREISAGGTLRFELEEKPTNWGKDNIPD